MDSVQSLLANHHYDDAEEVALFSADFKHAGHMLSLNDNERKYAVVKNGASGVHKQQVSLDGPAA